MCYQFCGNCKILPFGHHLKEIEMKITYACPFLRVSQKLEKKIESLYGFGGRCLNITDVCMDFKPCFKIYNLVSVYLKNIKLGQMTTLNVIFHVVVPIYRLFKIWNSPQFRAQFRNGQLSWCSIDGVKRTGGILLMYTYQNTYENCCCGLSKSIKMLTLYLHLK